MISSDFVDFANKQIFFAFAWYLVLQKKSFKSIWKTHENWYKWNKKEIEHNDSNVGLVS